MMKFLTFDDVVSRSSILNLVGAMRDEHVKNVYVSSPGGEFEFFSILAPVLMRQGFNTIAGKVYSAAMILYILGNRRYALADSEFLFHDVRAIHGFGGQITICDLEQFLDYETEIIKKGGQGREHYEEWLRQMKSAQAWFVEFMYRRLDVNPGTFLDLMHNNAVLSAKEAKRYGIVHEIIPEGELEKNRNLEPLYVPDY